MRRGVGVATALILIMPSVAAAADDYPPRKAGLWEVTIQAENKPAATTKMCIDADTDQLFHKFGTDLRSKHCEKNDVKANGDTVNADSVCKVKDTTISTSSVTKFTGDSAYHVDIKIHFDPALLGKTDVTSAQDAKWTGPCPADMKPGDFVMGNGIKVNIVTLNKLKGLLQQ